MRTLIVALVIMAAAEAMAGNYWWAAEFAACSVLLTIVGAIKRV